MEILKSATKIVFLLVALAVCIGFFLGKLSNEQFVGIAMMVFAFYYAKPSTPTV